MCTLPEREKIEGEREIKNKREGMGGKANNIDWLKQRQEKPTKWAPQGMVELSRDDSDMLEWDFFFQAAYIRKHSL